MPLRKIGEPVKKNPRSGIGGTAGRSQRQRALEREEANRIERERRLRAGEFGRPSVGNRFRFTSAEREAFFNSPAQRRKRQIAAAGGPVNTPRQKNPRSPIFARAEALDLLAGGVASVGLVNALTIGGVPGVLTSQGVGRGSRSTRKPRNTRK